MCIGCTFNNREKDFPWLRTEVEKYIQQHRQAWTPPKWNADFSERIDWEPPQPYSTTWYMIENFILQREGYFTKSGKFKKGRAGRRHLLQGKSSKRKRHLRGSDLVSSTMEKQLRRLMPYA